MSRNPVALCGTLGGVAKHRANGESRCEACKAASREYARMHRSSRATRAARDYVRFPDIDTPICASDPELWFPHKGGSANQAKQFCRACPFIDACLTYALRHTVDGVWGGTSPRQRRKIQLAQGIIAIPVTSQMDVA